MPPSEPVAFPVMHLRFILRGIFAEGSKREHMPLRLEPPTEPGRTADLARRLLGLVTRGLEQPYGASALDKMTPTLRGHLRALLQQAYNAGRDAERAEQATRTVSQRYLGETP